MRNLLKYDFKYTWRIWWPTLLIAAFSTLIGVLSIKRTILGDQSDTLLPTATKGIVDGLSVAGIIAFVLVIIAYVLIIELVVQYRYYKNMFTDEGYLTFTLPVTENQVLLSKSISGFVWYVITACTAAALGLTGGLAAVRYFSNNWEEFKEGMKEVVNIFFTENGDYAVIFIVEAIVLLLVGCIFNLELGYISITIGSIIAKKNKLLAGIGVYFVICTAFSIFSSIFGGKQLLDIYSADIMQANHAISTLLIVMIAVLAVVAAIVYVLNLLLLKKKLNLA
ncbi:MAG: hypothetical protein MJ146_00775 [Clostridia bacterium]|nr:hypothetical protein [Clostridia bacterium]